MLERGTPVASMVAESTVENPGHAGGINPGGSGRPLSARLHRILKTLLVLSVFCFTLGGTAQAGRSRKADSAVDGTLKRDGVAGTAIEQRRPRRDRPEPTRTSLLP